MKYDKIFVIGNNKTGTKSFNALFNSLGLKSQHDRKSWDFDKYTCFTDGFHDEKKFIQYDEAFKNSLFILNTRPLDHWLKSKSKHAYISKSRRQWPPKSEQYIEYINQRNKHFNDILNYFNDKNDRLLICNIEAVNWENFIKENIRPNNLKNYSVHENKIDESSIDPEAMKLINEELNKAYEYLNYTEESKIKLLPENQYTFLYKQIL